MNVLMLIVLNRTNPILLRFWNSRTLFLIGCSLQTCGAIALFTALTVNAHIYIVSASIAVICGSIGLISPNGLTCLLECHVENSGSAVAVMGASNFIFGAFAGSVLSNFQVESPWPLATIMVTCSLAAFIVLATATAPILYAKNT